MKKEEQIKHFSNPGWVAYLSPFTLIVPDGEEPLNVDLEEINSNTYDHGKLCRIVSTMEIKHSDLDLIICYDGALSIPKFKPFVETEIVVDFFNNLFCKILLGGIYCEAIDRRDIVNGRLYKKKHIWPVDLGKSASTQLHCTLRMKLGTSFNSIILSNPNYILLSKFHQAVQEGDKILSIVNNLTPKFLIRGVTEIKYRNWDLVLSNLWITVEQLIDFIWNNIYLSNEKYHPKDPITGRIQSLKNDSRTWSTSVKQEILFQNQLLSESIISKLFPGRQSRNKLVHEGKGVSKDVAINLYKAVKLLLEKATGIDNIHLVNINDDSQETISEKAKFDIDYFDDWKNFKINLHPTKDEES